MINSGGGDLAVDGRETGCAAAQVGSSFGHTRLHADAVRVLTDWRAPDAAQNALRHAYLAFLAALPDATARECVPGHLTASVVVLSADRKQVLLTLHRRVGLWLQLGGHCEPDDASLWDAASREAMEESGVSGLALGRDPLHLDVHPITCSLGVPTRHFDVQYLALAPAGAVPVISDESADLRFWPADALPERTDDAVRRAVTAAVDRTANAS